MSINWVRSLRRLWKRLGSGAPKIDTGFWIFVCIRDFTYRFQEKRLKIAFLFSPQGSFPKSHGRCHQSGPSGASDYCSSIYVPFFISYDVMLCSIKGFVFASYTKYLQYFWGHEKRCKEREYLDVPCGQHGSWLIYALKRRQQAVVKLLLTGCLPSDKWSVKFGPDQEDCASEPRIGLRYVRRVRGVDMWCSDWNAKYILLIVGYAGFFIHM